MTYKISTSSIFISRIILFWILNIVVITSILFDQVNGLLFSVLLFVIHNVLYCIEKLESRIFFLFFQLTFFLFLEAKPLILLITGEELISSINSNLFFDQLSIEHNIITLLLSQYSLFFAYYLFDKFQRDNENKLATNYNASYIKRVRSISIKLMYISFIPALFILIEKGIFVKSSNFTSYYVDYTSKFPLPIIKISEAFRPLFYIYLATLPNKKEAKLPIIVFLIYSVATLSFGQRNEFILNLIVLFVYFYLRNSFSLDIKEKWFSFKEKITILILCPLIIIFSVIYDYIRRDLSISNVSLIQIIKEFFITQGSSNEIITHGYLLEERIPKQEVYYTFGTVYNYITQNIVFSSLFDNEQFAQNSIEMATRGHSFSATLTYLNYPINYLNGIGMGSSYVAELYFDFGYVGIILGSIVIAIVLKYLNTYIFSKWIFTFFALLCLQSLLFIPRSSFLDWIAQPFSILNIALVLTIHFLSKISTGKNYSEGSVVYVEKNTIHDR